MVARTDVVFVGPSFFIVAYFVVIAIAYDHVMFSHSNLVVPTLYYNVLLHFTLVVLVLQCSWVLIVE
jgi:hypothetical protein